MAEKQPDDVRNEYQQEQLAHADTTMEENREGNNIDARGISKSELKKGMEYVEPHNPNEIGESLRGKGGMYFSEIREGQLSEEDRGV